MGDEQPLVVLRDDLHQALGAHDAFGDRVEARLDRDDGEHEVRIQTDVAGGAVSRVHHQPGRLVRNEEAAGQVLGEHRLRGIG